MLTPVQRYRVVPKIRRMMMLSAGYIFASVAFATGVGIATGGVIDFNQISLMSLSGILTGLLMYVLSFIFPLLILANRTQLAAQLAKENRSTLIPEDIIIDALMVNRALKVGLAGIVTLGGIFLNLITFFVEQCGAAAVVAGLGILILLIHFPWKWLQFRYLNLESAKIKKELNLIRLG